jgi:hypothetical protein
MVICLGVYICMQNNFTHVLRKIKASSTNWLIWMISLKPCLANISSRIFQIRNRDTLKFKDAPACFFFKSIDQKCWISVVTSYFTAKSFCEFHNVNKNVSIKRIKNIVKLFSVRFFNKVLKFTKKSKKNIVDA